MRTPDTIVITTADAAFIRTLQAVDPEAAPIEMLGKRWHVKSVDWRKGGLRGGGNGTARLEELIEVKVEPSGRRRRLTAGECGYCDQHGYEDMMPPHDASAECESGKNPHCTCDACF